MASTTWCSVSSTWAGDRRLRSRAWARERPAGALWDGMCPLTVALLTWSKGDGLSRAISSVLEELGCRVIAFGIQDRLPDETDLVFVFGPLGPIVPLVNRLLEMSPPERPLFVLWMTEQLSNPAIPEWVHRPLSELRSSVERGGYCWTPEGRWQLGWWMRWLAKRAHRLRYYGDLQWLKRTGVLSVLATGSDWVTSFLRARGLPAMTAYLGSHSDWWAELKIERDIPVLWLGKMGSDRRRRMLDRVRRDLRRRGVEVLVIDGVENPYVFDTERTVLLNRSIIVLNLLRTKWDNHSLRHFLAASNRALVVSEPTLRHIPFEPGRHSVETPIGQMAESIGYYLKHEEERQRITDRAFELVTRDLTMSGSVCQIIDQAIEIRRPKNAG